MNLAEHSALGIAIVMGTPGRWARCVVGAETKQT